ncbi:tyrosine-type recombinase/integrase [Lysinibacillus capsici]|uniref:tyrosine-type recombinase/integrase n=1 Tax=Lysinibacillus capsici TaxID=2115968 RepID=UPI00289854E0|nr:tyrosine-type recombinase/integrase [Lysinibacillus capsici]
MARNPQIKEYTLKDGEKRFMFKFYLGTDSLTGKPLTTTRRGFKSRKEAQDAMNQLQLEVYSGTYKKQQYETYQDIYNMWVEQYENGVEESTFVKTIGIFKNHILPAMGTYKVDKIDIATCQKHVNHWAKKLKRFRMVKSYAAKVLDYAIKHGYIDKNPFTLVEMPKKRKQIVLDEAEFENFYEREQLIKLLQSFEQQDNLMVYTIFHVLSYSGMRKGEVLALTWNDINFERSDIRINKAISRGKDCQLYLKTTKNGVVRTIKMDETSMSLLLKWKFQQSKIYLEKGINTSNKKQLVFSNKHNRFIQPVQTQKWLHKVIDKYKLQPITTHGLRHTHCSLLFEAGASIKEVQERLGHTDVKTTMDIYTHVTKKTKASTIEKFDAYINSR